MVKGRDGISTEHAHMYVRLAVKILSEMIHRLGQDQVVDHQGEK